MNPTSGTPVLKTCTSETSPQMPSLENQQGACPQDPQGCHELKNSSHAGTNPPRCPDQRQPMVPRCQMKEAHLLIINGWPEGQAPNLTHFQEPAGTTQEEDRQVPSSHSLSSRSRGPCSPRRKLRHHLLPWFLQLPPRGHPPSPSSGAQVGSCPWILWDR